MKFSDGNWLIPDDLALLHPLFVHHVAAEGDSLIAHIAARPQQTRGDMLNTAVFTLRLTAVGDGMIAVRLCHYEGALNRGPHFQVTPQPCDPVIAIGPDYATLTTGGLTARLPVTGAYRLDFLRGDQRLTGAVPRSAGRSLRRGDGAVHMFDRLDLEVGETVHGLGERFGAFVKNGQSIDIWNRDGGTGTDQAYKNIPFALMSGGWGLFVNHPGRVEFEIGTERVSKIQFSVPGEVLDYIVIDGPTPKEVLTRYTALTGRPTLPPKWSFGLWLSTSFTTDYDEAVVKSFVDGMAQRAIPMQVFHYDCHWMKGGHWCDFEWDPDTFPDPEGQLTRMHDRGTHVCVWINPYISQLSSLFAEGRDKGYFLKRPDGSVWQWDLWQPGQAIVDFTNPAACAWYTGHLGRLMAMGVDSFKTDFGERIPTDVVWHDGSDPERMHNYYAYLYNQVVFDYMASQRGGDAIVFARSATTGGQKFPVHWGGDCDSTYPSMAESLRGGLSLGLSGFGYWSHDIGGFEGTAAPDVYKRWCAFGLLSSHSRLHGSDSYRVPWAFDEEAVEVLRHFVTLKCRLMPYLWQIAKDAAETGVPMMRAMLLEFPDDPAAPTLDRQYMLGDRLLVAPVFRADGRADVYLPHGTWTHLLTGEVKQGGWHREVHDVFSLPLYVRGDSLIAMGARDDTVLYDYAAGAEVHLFALGDGASATCTVEGDSPLAVTAQRSGDQITVTANRDGWTLTYGGQRHPGQPWMTLPIA